MPTLRTRRVRPWERSFIRPARRRAAPQTAARTGWTLFIPDAAAGKRG